MQLFAFYIVLFVHPSRAYSNTSISYGFAGQVHRSLGPFVHLHAFFSRCLFAVLRFLKCNHTFLSGLHIFLLREFQFRVRRMPGRHKLLCFILVYPFYSLSLSYHFPPRRTRKVFFRPCHFQSPSLSYREVQGGGPVASTSIPYPGAAPPATLPGGLPPRGIHRLVHNPPPNAGSVLPNLFLFLSFKFRGFTSK